MFGLYLDEYKTKLAIEAQYIWLNMAFKYSLFVCFICVVTIFNKLIFSGHITLCICFYSIWFFIVLVYRYYLVSRYQRQKEILKGSPIKTISVDELAKYNLEDSLYLGDGYIWEKSHAKLLYQFHEGRVELPKIFKDPKKRGATYIHSIGEEKPIHIPLNFLDGHTLILGTTGAGKTRLFDIQIAQAILRKECVIILDPKGDKDLYNHTLEVVKSANLPSVLYFHPGFPEKSISINPLYNFSRSTELASRLASLLPVSRAGTGDTFKSFAQMSLNTVIGGLLILKQRPTLKSIRYYVDSRIMELAYLAFKSYIDSYIPDSERASWSKILKTEFKQPGVMLRTIYDVYLKYIKPTNPSAPLEALYVLARHDATHYGKMIASLIPSLDMLCSGELGSLLSPNLEVSTKERLWDFERLINKSRVVYIGLDSLTDGIVGSNLGSLLLADLAAVAGSRYNYSSHISKVNIFVDEASEVINDQLIQILNKGRGAGFRVVAAAQTVSDFETRLGSEAKAMQALGNFNNLISLRVIDKATRNYVAESLPKVRIPFFSSSQANNHISNNTLNLNNSQVEQICEQEVQIFPEGMFAELPDLEFLARVGGATVYKGKLPFIKSNKTTLKQ